MYPNLKFTKYQQVRKRAIRAVVLMVCALILGSLQLCYAQKPKLKTVYMTINMANLDNCKLLGQIDSIVRTAKDSLPKCDLDVLSSINLVEIADIRDTTYSEYKEEKILHYKSYPPQAQDIINIFEGGKPSHDLRIIFAGLSVIGNGSGVLMYNGTPFFVEENIYKILQYRYKFKKERVKQTFWYNVHYDYKEPVFSVVVTKEGTLRNIEYFECPIMTKCTYRFLSNKL